MNRSLHSTGRALTRRELLATSGQGFGSIALASLLGSEGLFAASPSSAATRPPKARRVIQLFMAGAASHVDLFDYKPELVKHHGEASDFGEQVEAFQNGLGPWKKPAVVANQSSYTVF